ncbi:hypothetical protein BDN72DRAFT_830184 [Pluteus cervinus]|uniref:Uncharacterized protein n=1 Tax=Pluteus cervinus TaxID=181527 RepID=A0ACD3BG54_9AGAR|nr:hypothetical protein BDN72DRAFT_830184 [Pluteus cervinus]
MANLPQKYGNFDLVERFKLDFADIAISKWRSRVTGLSVVHLDYDAPIVKGYFVVATEIFDDSGCPHTLEHLVFMGSEKYPHKGILDLFANRGFANGTNAWTDTDHTAYTVSTAGDQGFLQLLPIYVDHILYPTITDAGFTTEVHHIDAKGEDSGVVYSEMQGRQNTSGDIMGLELQRAVYPSGSAYRSETGGLMEALRVLTAEQIRNYHKSYYLPHNLCLIVAGHLSKGTESLLSVVHDKIEPSLVEHKQNKGPRPTGWKRPFLETPSAKRDSPVSVRRNVEFPEKDETLGELIISFRGPPHSSFLERKALDIIGTYLTSSAVAPLNKEYVETESPLCTYIYFSEDTRATYVDLPIYVGSVPIKNLPSFDGKLKASLQNIVDAGIDMKRMKMVIDRDERQLRSTLESAKGDTFSGTIISDFLYGSPDGSELLPSMNEIDQFAELRTWTSKQWTDLLKKYYIDQPSVVITGTPSSKLAEKIEKDETLRIEEQVKVLGPDGIKKKGEALEAAKAEHDRPIPTDLLTSFPLPDEGNISWIPVESVQEPGRTRERRSNSDKLSHHIELDGAELPFFVQYDHVESKFVTIHAYLSLAKLPDRLRPLISAYLSSFFSLPVKRQSGERLSHEEVVDQLDNDTVSYEVSLGIAGSYFSELFRVSIKVEVSHYETAIAWLRDLLYGAEFDQERLQVVVAKIQQSLPELKRDGNNVLSSLSAELLFDERSTSRAGGVLPQLASIPALATQLLDDPKSVIADFEEIRKHLTNPTGIRFSVTGNIFQVDKPRSLWNKYFSSQLTGTDLTPPPITLDTLSKVGAAPGGQAIVMSLPTIESSFVTHLTRSIQGFNHPEYPALYVALEVLNATESYLWRYIRGSGLAYGARVYLDQEAGHLSFSLYRSSNSTKAFDEAASVVRGLVEGSVLFDTTTLDAAKSAIVARVATGVSTAGRASIKSFTNQALMGVSQNHQIELLKKYRDITKEDVLAALRKHVLPLFDSKSSVVIAVTAPSKAEQISDNLTNLGFNVERRELEVETEEAGELGDEDSGSGSEASR